MSNNKCISRLLLAIVLMFSLNKMSVAQEAADVVLPPDLFTSGFQLGIGTRAIAMGGAFTSIGRDYSASLWNPAALADIKRIEMFGSMSHLMRKNTTNLLTNTDVFSNSTRDDDATFTKFNDIGFAYPVPTTRGSLVFSFGFNRIKTYDSNFDFSAFNESVGDSSNQAWKEIENGSLNSWILSGAIDVSPNISVGLALNFWKGGTDFETRFRDRDTQDYWYDDVFSKDENINWDINGFNVKLGGLYRIGNFARIGATIATPITFKIKETWSESLDYRYDIGAEEVGLNDTTIIDDGFSEFKIKSPFTFTSGASISFAKLVLSGDIEYNDWSQVRYETDLPILDLDKEGNYIIDEEGDPKPVTKTKGNSLIRDKYRATVRIRLGAEFTLPLTGLSLRAGYFKDPSIFQNDDVKEDKQFYSAGLGFLLDKQVKLDIAFVHGFWKDFHDRNEEGVFSDDVERYVEDIKVNKVFVSLAFRL